MDILLLVFFLLIFIFIRPRADKLDYLSVDSALPLRGIMAIAIVLHHMSEKTTGGVLFPFMQHMGYLIVAVFFFLSGYGLMISYLSKGSIYLKSFWKKRILYLFCIFALVSAVYSIYYLLIGKFKPSLMIAANSWYIIIQILLYIIFWFSFSAFGRKAGIVSVFVFQTILMFVLIWTGKAGIWYISNYGFTAGIIWAEKKETMDALLNKHYWICVVVSVAIFALFSALPLFIGGYDICRIISSVAFCLIVVLILYRIKIVGKLWSWLGGISLEIYLLHGLVITLLKNSFHVQNGFLWSVLTIVISVLIAAPVHKMNEIIAKKCRSIAKKLN